jgi:protein-arginine kinase activator protein McsA
MTDQNQNQNELSWVLMVQELCQKCQEHIDKIEYTETGERTWTEVYLCSKCGHRQTYEMEY